MIEACQKAQIPLMKPIKKIVAETAQVKTFVFAHDLGAKPGQFVNLWLPRHDEKPFSVAHDDGREFWITFFAIGPFTEKLQTLKAGDSVGIRGPYGSYYRYRNGERLALVAGGYGAAPMYFVAEQALQRGCAVDFIVGARSAEQLLFLQRIRKLRAKGEIRLHIATDDGSKGYQGYNVALLQKLVAEGLCPDRVFACGPELMLKSLSDYCAVSKLPAQLSLERYMKCGFGVCGHCALDPLGLLACTDGPVLDNELCRQLTEFGNYHRDRDGKKIFFNRH